jgi:hypothetical protein
MLDMVDPSRIWSDLRCVRTTVGTFSTPQNYTESTYFDKPQYWPHNVPPTPWCFLPTPDARPAMSRIYPCLRVNLNGEMYR